MPGKANMSDLLQRVKEAERSQIAFAVVVLACAVCLAFFLVFYFQNYQDPYMMDEIVDISENWQYRVGGSAPVELDNLSTGPKIGAGETLTLTKTIDADLPDAAIMVRANHQTVNVYLDGTPLLLSGETPTGQNPGMSLHFIQLPEGYAGGTLTIELTSPYALYAGRTSPVFLGTVQSLETYAVSHSMRSVILMAMCLFIGVCAVALTFVQALHGSFAGQNLAIGIFAVVWGLYYVCTEYLSFLFFAPVQMSLLSLGLYFSFQIPLTLFLYFSFNKYKKQMLPAVIVPAVFVAAAFVMQALDVMGLPELVNVNNVLLAGLIYAIVLCVLEAVRGNRIMVPVSVFLIIAYVSMLYNFNVFYARRGVVPYSYRDTYFLLIVVILIYNVQQFFSKYYRRVRESEMLSLQNRLAQESYDHIKVHLQEVGGLKHEVKNHFAALQAYLEARQYQKARDYLAQYAGEAEAVTETVFHGNFLINAMIGKLMRLAEQDGIRVELNLRASPTRISGTDLYSLLTNILENAREACAAVPEGMARFIRLTLLRRDPYLTITCKNSRAGEFSFADGKLQSNKQGGGHGYGLWTIERIAEAYHGLVDIDYDRNTFTITVALKD